MLNRKKKKFKNALMCTKIMNRKETQFCKMLIRFLFN